MQPLERIRHNLADAFAFPLFMNEQGLAEGPAGENIHVLFERHLIVARERAQQGRRGRIHVLGHHRRKRRLAEIGQSAPPGARHEFGETARLVAVFEELVADVGIIRVTQIVRLGAENLPQVVSAGVFCSRKDSISRARATRSRSEPCGPTCSPSASRRVCRSRHPG